MPLFILMSLGMYATPSCNSKQGGLASSTQIFPLPIRCIWETNAHNQKHNPPSEWQGRKLAQQQLKLQDDSKIIEDSLIALSKRVFEIESFVTRELGQMKKYMNESTNTIKQRRIGQTTGKQQMAMTSMNNLALMLAESLKNMQNDMNSSSSGKGKGKKSKKVLA